MSHKEISFPSDSPPVCIHVEKVIHVSCHWHSALEVIWVLDGQVDIQESAMLYHLYKDDIYVVNYNETHRIFTDGNAATLLFLHLDPTYFTRYIHNLLEISFSHYCFSTNLNIDDGIKACRNLLATVFFTQNTLGDPASIPRFGMESVTNALLSALVSNFQYIYFKKTGDNMYQDCLERSNELSPENMERLHRLTYYIYMNSGRKLGLEELAETEYYSKFYISHFIRKAQGLNFQDTLSFSRISISERLLLDTDKTIDDIASLAGFSTRQVYCAQFKRWHGILPTEFRKQNRCGASGNIDQIYECSREYISELLSQYKQE